LVADKLSQSLKEPFVVENRPGAGGIAAMRAVLDAPADGYTLGEMGNGQTISVSLFEKLPYNVLQDFAQISFVATLDMLLAVPPNSPYKTVKDLIEAARRAPGTLNLGAINPGSTQNLSAHLFQEVSGAQFTIVTYRTTPDLVTALLRGDVDLGFDYFAGFGASIGPDRLRIIATSGDVRDPLLKDVPTAKESGLPDYAVTSWNGLAAAGTPADIVKARYGLVSKPAPARPKKCTTGWRATSPNGTTSSRRLPSRNNRRLSRRPLNPRTAARHIVRRATPGRARRRADNRID
jgi:tripartite-type tricarboxylate transporter receptor subunit TctC